MKISKVGIDLIKEFEGCQLTAYRCPAGVWTIGIGHTGVVDGKPIVGGMTITMQKAEDLLSSSLKFRYEPAVQKLGTMNQNQYDALVSFCYNLGPGIFKGSLLDAIEAKNWLDVARQMKLYNKARVGGVLTELRGLTRRRNAEADLLLKPMPTEKSEDKVKSDNIEIELNGKSKMVEAINVNGFNYIKLRDLADKAIEINFDKIPIVRVRG